MRTSVFDILDGYLRVTVEGRWDTREIWINGMLVEYVHKPGGLMYYASETPEGGPDFYWGPRHPGSYENTKARNRLMFTIVKTIKSLFPALSNQDVSRDQINELKIILDTLPQSDFKKTVRLPIRKKGRLA